LSILESSKLAPLKLENSSGCAGLKQFQFLRSASLSTFIKMVKRLHSVISKSVQGYLIYFDTLQLAAGRFIFRIFEISYGSGHFMR